MDTVRKLIICAILGAFYVPVVSAYEFHDPYPNVKVIDGEVHIQRPGGGTSLAYPNAGISKDIPVNTSKGQFLVPVEKTFPVEPSKVGKAATRFLKSAPFVGTAIAIYDTVCDLTDICRDSETGELMYLSAGSLPSNWPQSIDFVGVYRTSSSSPTNAPTPELSCYLYDRKYLSDYPDNYDLRGPWFYSGDGVCQATKNPSFNVTTVYYAGTCPPGYVVGGVGCVASIPAIVRSPVEDDWTAAETKLNAQPQQTAEALYNSDAPVPVSASTQSDPVTQQIAQTSTQTKDAQGNVTGTQTATTTVKVEDTSTTNNVTYNITETTTITNYNENNEITGTETSTFDNQPPTRTDETTVSFDDVPPAQLEEEQPEFNLQTPESWGEGTCPPDEILTVQGVTFPVSWQPACDTAVQLRPIFVLFASVAAMFIVAGISRAGT